VKLLKHLIKALLEKGQRKIVRQIILSNIDYAHEVNEILNSEVPKDQIQAQLKKLVDSYKTQTNITCPFMELVLKQTITIENVKKAMNIWRKTGQEPC
jgi:hypothetical protein